MAPLWSGERGVVLVTCLGAYFLSMAMIYQMSPFFQHGDPLRAAFPKVMPSPPPRESDETIQSWFGRAAAGDKDPLESYLKACGGQKVLKRILVASNGMAAAKVMMSMRQWAHMEANLGERNILEFVAMATKEDLDANAEFIRLADQHVEVPGGKNVNNYANVDLICKIAKTHKVDAVWPGWGHASENPRLPAKLKELGICFIGPTSPVMSVLGDKIAAGILAQTAGVPSIPWSGDGLTAELTKEGTIPDEVFAKACLSSSTEALHCAERIGFPVMLKASEGGGGKGIRMSQSKEELEQHFAQVQAEVPGSPIFMMQLCSGARHIEVQIVGDQHGQVVALSGRDCSTQRRFQKIFEEGPPVIVPRSTFKEMERAAQRLTASIGYMGAGTIEYLYNAKTNQFYFLELNPRLQVEHPVTEAITGVNLPATQLQVAMGIPLDRMPQIRSFYGKSTWDTSKIDFMTDEYVYPKVHCIAARITAENPDDGFKPTSGKIDRIKFQSSVACWGYFSVWTHAAIHEFADSQFGHLFARGEDREEARKTLVLALSNLEVVGEIRTPIEYLVELLRTEAFCRNSIDTSWLDGMIRERTVKVKYEKLDVVFYAAVLRAVRRFEARDKDLAEAIAKRRLGLLHQVGHSSVDFEIAFEGHKFQFLVRRLASNLYDFTVADQTIQTQVRVQPDNSLLVSIDGSVMKVSGSEEALGLRLRLQGIGTVLLPTIFDPSELRSDFNGKVIRYLVPEGGVVQKGQAYVELEAMKMVMPLKASAAGLVKQLKGPGSIVAAGELLARLQLEDPSSAPQLDPFVGTFSLASARPGPSAPTAPEAAAKVCRALEGYAMQGTRQQLAKELLMEEETGSKLDQALTALEHYLSVERKFSDSYAQGCSMDLVVAKLLDAESSPEEAARDLSAHGAPGRAELVGEILQGLEALQPQQKEVVAEGKLPRATSQKLWQSVREQGNWTRLADLLTELAELPAVASYAPVRLAARRLCQTVTGESWMERFQKLQAALKSGEQKVLTWPPHEAGCNLLAHALSEKEVQVKALEVLIRRSYRAFGVSKDSTIRIERKEESLEAKWKFRHPGIPCDAKTMTVWQGIAKVFPNYDSLKQYLDSELQIVDRGKEGEGLKAGRLHLVLLGEEAMTSAGSEERFHQLVTELHQLLRQVEAKLQSLGALEVVLMLPKHPSLGSNADEPRFAFFAQRASWTEVLSCRDLGFNLPCLLEVERLEAKLERLPPVSSADPQSEVFLATGSGSAKVVHVRSVSHSRLGFQPSSNSWVSRLEALLLAVVHEMECARLSPKAAGSEGRMFLYLTSLAEIAAMDLFQLLQSFVVEFVARHGALLQALWLDEITLKVRLGSEADGCQGVLRFIATSGAGEYMKCRGWLEEVDPLSGSPVAWRDLSTGQTEATAATAGTEEAQRRQRRQTARRAGSTYAPEFLGLLEVALVKDWANFSRKRQCSVPKELLVASELKMSSGELQESDRKHDMGSTDIGMLAWRLFLRTPEFPEGRSLVLIANDVTHQAGSFGVAEDQFFKKATEYARQRGLPRVYIACNSGARVGLVDEIIPKLQVQWKDASDPSKGFDFLYLTEADYQSLPAGAVIAHRVPEGYALEAVVGLGCRSIDGGIGVENLQGSGSIAGETSRAYNDIFTLSYVTGRSVGIGAYLNRLGQRVIQSVDGPLVLTGYGALNKLLGKNVYFSQDQLGGPQIMVPNGITHQLVQNDQEGAEAILQWLSFVPRDTWSLPQSVTSLDPPERVVEFRPTKQAYDPRHMLAGTTTDNGNWVSGFFDRGSFVEYMAGWGRSVVVGRARLGGIPMGVIAVETRNVERRIPADPGNPESREIVEPQAGQVWFPDSAYKTATAIRDFNVGENLPLMIFANWRGFSGGTRDMYGEVLKFGAQIVDALVDYKQPVFIYIPPEGELRGGSWVVVDPAINPEVMEMYADQDSRGGILEPAGVVEVKFRAAQRRELMHRLDEKLQKLDEQMKTSPSEEVQQEIQAREEMLQPLYTQVACEFADLHDRAGRMKAVGAIKESLEWHSSREFFYWRLRRSLLEKGLIRDLRAADSAMNQPAAMATVQAWLKEDAGGSCSDRRAVELLQAMSAKEKVRSVHAKAVKRQFHEVCDELVRSGQLGPLGRCFFRCLVPKRADRAVPLREETPAPRVTPAPLPGLLGKVQVEKKPA